MNGFTSIRPVTYILVGERKMALQRTLGVYAMISLPIVRDMTVDHVAGLAFGGQRPHSSEEHVQGPNALILHSMKVSPDHNIATYNVYVLGKTLPNIGQ